MVQGLDEEGDDPNKRVAHLAGLDIEALRVELSGHILTDFPDPFRLTVHNEPLVCRFRYFESPQVGECNVFDSDEREDDSQDWDFSREHLLDDLSGCEPAMHM